MKEYIEKEKVMAETWKEPNFIDPWNAVMEVRDRIDDLPVADVRPVEHGEWILREEVTCGNYLYECSKCGHKDIQAKSVEVPYCWFCGAMMTKKVEP